MTAKRYPTRYQKYIQQEKSRTIAQNRGDSAPHHEIDKGIEKIAAFLPTIWGDPTVSRAVCLYAARAFHLLVRRRIERARVERLITFNQHAFVTAQRHDVPVEKIVDALVHGRALVFEIDV